MANRKQVCPRCGSFNAAKIVYGEPAESYSDITPKVLGGCAVSADSPAICCLDCNYRWGGKSTDFLAGMKRFRASIGGYFGPSYAVEVDRTNETITYRHTDDGPNGVLKMRPLTTEIWTKFLKGLVRCELIDWLDEYTDRNVLDGTSWSVEMIFPSGEEICKYGSNLFPGRWNQFCRLMSSISGMKFR